MTKYHWHHIWPQHAIGPPPKDNLVYCTTEEHAEFHRVLYEKWGRKEDFLAWKGLAKLAGKEDIAREALVLSNQRRKGIKHSPEVIAKRKYAMRGIPKSVEHKKKLSEANLGKKQSKEIVERRSARQRGQKRNEEFCRANSERMKGKRYALGCTRSEETKRKLSESAKLMWLRRKALQNEKASQEIFQKSHEKVVDH